MAKTTTRGGLEATLKAMLKAMLKVTLKAMLEELFSLTMLKTFFHAVELSTNSLRAFVACWNYDLYTVSIHIGTFNEFPGGMCGILNL